MRGAYSGHPRLVGMCRELYDHRAWLWTFLAVEGVEPTNNASERALRHAVIWRKLSFGTQSAARETSQPQRADERGRLPVSMRDVSDDALAAKGPT